MSASQRVSSVSKVNVYGAIIFTLGCLVLVVNAVLTIYALAKPGFQPPRPYFYAQGALSLLSSVLFVTGGGFGIIYVVKARQEDDLLVGVEPSEDADLEKGVSQLRRAPALSEYSIEVTIVDEKPQHQEEDDTNNINQRNILQRCWYSSREVWYHYTGEIGFWTTIIFLCSSVIFLGANIASMVTIITAGEILRCVRYPQLVGSIGFAIASAMIMVSAYKQAHAEHPGKWWQLPWHHRRWYVGFGNLVGSAGFTICAIAGLIVGSEWSKDQFGISFTWGSWFFLFASALQWQRSRSKMARAKAMEAAH